MGGSCKEDIEDADRVQGLLQDLENIRADRLRMGMLSVANASFEGQRVHLVKVCSPIEFLFCDEYMRNRFDVLTSVLSIPPATKYNINGNFEYQEIFPTIYGNF